MLGDMLVCARPWWNKSFDVLCRRCENHTYRSSRIGGQKDLGEADSDDRDPRSYRVCRSLVEEVHNTQDAKILNLRRDAINHIACEY